MKTKTHCTIDFLVNNPEGKTNYARFIIINLGSPPRIMAHLRNAKQKIAKPYKPHD
jgi:hypothetical protein